MLFNDNLIHALNFNTSRKRSMRILVRYPNHLNWLHLFRGAAALLDSQDPDFVMEIKLRNHVKKPLFQNIHLCQNINFFETRFLLTCNE